MGILRTNIQINRDQSLWTRSIIENMKSVFFFAIFACFVALAMKRVAEAGGKRIRYNTYHKGDLEVVLGAQMDQEVDREVDKLFADAKWVEGIAPKLKEALDQVNTGQRGRAKREMILF